MRDYKNVTVPRKYRTGATKRVKTRRVDAGRGGRKKSGPVKRLLQVLVLLLVAASCWVGWKAYGMMMDAGMFRISGIDVSGVRALDEAELKEIVGHFTGQNIFSVDLQEAARRARGNPWVRDVTIRRSLPNRIAMEVTERVPCAVLESASGRWLMDRETVVLARAAGGPEDASELPVIEMRSARVRPGDQATSESLVSALALLAEIESRGGWNPGDITIKAGTPDSISIVYAGREFKTGSGRYAEKLRRLAEVMADTERRGLEIASVDLRPETQVAVTAKNDRAQGKRPDAGRPGGPKRR